MNPENFSSVIRGLDFDYFRYQEYIKLVDAAFIEKHNLKYPASSKYHLRTDLEPCPFEGDLKKAKVILLLANPYADSTTTAQDHVPIGDGWGIWGISNTASSGMRDWWRPRLKSLVHDAHDEIEWKRISNKVASFQVVAWASEKFHEVNRLPSKVLMLETLQYLNEFDPSKIFVVMRQRKHWQKALETVGNDRVLFTKNPLCSYISEPNMINKDSWQRLLNAVQD